MRLDGESMIIHPKETRKLIGIVIMCACAILPCTLLLNSNMDLMRIRDLIIDPESLIVYELALNSGYMIAAIAGGALALTTAIMLFFYIKHYIDTHRSEIGILKAMGYSNWKIAKSFWVFGMSVFIGAVIGFSFAFIIMPAFYREMRSDWILPDVHLHFNPLLVLYLIILPTLTFTLIAIFYSYFKLKRPPLELITGKGSKVIRGRKQKCNKDKDLPFLRELKQSTVRSRFSLVFFVGFASFCYANIVQMALGITDMAGDVIAIMMLGIGLALAFTTMFIAVMTVIKGNAKTIAMLRVFGYSNRDCSNTIINGYRPVACVGFIIGTAYQFGLMRMVIALFFDNAVFENSVVNIPEHSFNVPAFIITLVSFILFYEIFMKYCSTKIKRISLKEIMQTE